MLTTERQLLRPMTPDDASAMFALNADPEVLRYTFDGPFASVEAARAFLLEYQSVYQRPLRRRRARHRSGFEEVGLRRIIARAHRDNAASIRVMVKAGLVFERTLEEEDRPSVQYAIEVV